VATGTVVIAVLGGLVLTFGPPHRWVGDYLVTIAHEGGHAVAVVLCSGRVTAIRLHTRGSASRTGIAGLTEWRVGRRARWLVTLAGYPAPAAIGLGTLLLLHADRTRAALGLMICCLVVMLALIRNAFGAFLLVMVGALLCVAFAYGSAEVQTGVAGVVAWALLLGATRDALAAFPRSSGDASGMYELTGVPAKVWSLLFLLATAAATGCATWLTVSAWQ
jgi:Peptidase M50B-like